MAGNQRCITSIDASLLGEGGLANIDLRRWCGPSTAIANAETSADVAVGFDVDHVSVGRAGISWFFGC